jgi:hypothetical protein
VFAIRLDWVFTTAGLVSFAGWNALMVGLSDAFIESERRRRPIRARRGNQSSIVGSERPIARARDGHQWSGSHGRML